MIDFPIELQIPVNNYIPFLDSSLSLRMTSNVSCSFSKPVRFGTMWDKHIAYSTHPDDAALVAPLSAIGGKRREEFCFF